MSDRGAPPGLLPLAEIEAYLDSVGFGAGPLTATVLGDGHSNLTYRIDRADRAIVLRRPPRPPFPRGAHDVVREARLIEAMFEAGLMVPRILSVCESPEVIGVPFYLAELVDGRVVDGPLPPDLARADVASTLSKELVRGLVEVHAVPFSQAGLGRFGKPTGYLERQLRRFDGLRQAGDLRRIAALDEAFEWLTANLPGDSETTVVHGDYRLGNVMFGAGSPQLVAILDWELATIGDPLADVGWLAALWARPGDPVALQKLTPATLGAGFPTRRQLIDAYSAASGRSPRHLDWYLVLALWKFCIIMERNYQRAEAGLSDDEFARGLGPDLPSLAEFALEGADGNW